MDALVCFSNILLSDLSDINILLLWAWMLWESEDLEHGREFALGMDTLGIRCSCRRNLSAEAGGLGHLDQETRRVS